MKITNKLKILLISVLTIISIGFLESVQSPARPKALGRPKVPGKAPSPVASKKNSTGKNKTKKAGKQKQLKSNKTKNSNGTCYKKKNTNSTNVIGKFGKRELVYKFPFLLESCDQVLLVKGFVFELENYFNSTPVYMTMSAYMLNLFEKENPDNLLKSISLDKLFGVPTAIAGAPQCVAFKALNERINFCFKSEKIKTNVMTSVKQLLGCRKGIPIDNTECLRKIDFTVKGPFGKIGPKLKQQIELARLQMLSSNLSNSKQEAPRNKQVEKKKTHVNTKYYSLKVPGS